MNSLFRAARRFGLVTCASGALLSSATLAVVPYYGDGTATPAPPANAEDYASYLFIKDGDCSTGEPTPDLQRAGFNCRNFKFTDWREPPGLTQTYDPAVANNPQELYGVQGAATNKAWMVSTGRPDVRISVLDSGIEWQRPLRGLVNKLYLNSGELPKPACANGQAGRAGDARFGGYDCNGDGVFNVQDYAADARIGDRNGNGLLDPEDLIFTFSDGTDGDNNGYVDDISGWDFFENDNDPRDEVVYGHGTGEAEDSTGEAGFEEGQCPNCMVVPLRVGDSFVADVNHFAEAVVYSVDNGVTVIQEAEGDYNHTSFGQAALDYAYERGVIVNASEADENASHHMWPAAYDKTMVVNSFHAANRLDDLDPQLRIRPYSYLYFNACTNFGVYTYLAIPSDSCSSEATGRSSGISGLLQSAAKNAVERNQMTRYIADNGAQQPWALSAEELRQLWRLGADDIDFASPCVAGVGPHAGCDDAPAGVTAFAPPDNYVTTIPGAVRYDTVKGWDFFSGYGRANNGRTLRFIGLQGIPGFADQIEGPASLKAQDRIPPEAWIESPRWFRQYGYRADGTLLIPDDPLQPTQMVIVGHVAANRVTAAGGSFDYVVEWAPQVQGPNFAGSGGVDRSAPGSEEKSDGPWTVIASQSGLHHAVNGELARVDVGSIATGQSGSLNPFNAVTDPTSPFFPEISDVRLRVRVIAHPANGADTINNEAVSQKTVDVYAAAETIMRDDLGLRGKPSDGGASPTFHDIDGDGVDELIVAAGDGIVHAYTDVAAGTELAGWPVHTLPLASLGLHGVTNGGDVSYPDIHASGNNAYTRGDVHADFYSPILIGSPAVVDLDDDGKVEIITSDNEGHVYAWEPDGSTRPGFPVSVNFDWTTPVRCKPSTIPFCDAHVGAAQLKRDEFNRKDWGVISGVAVGDLDPSFPGLEMVAGASDGHLYAWRADGTRVPGWPVMLRDPLKLQSVDPVTHFLTHRSDSGVKFDVAILPTPSLGDIDGDGRLDVVSGVDEEYVETPNAAFDAATTVAGAALGGAGNNRIYVVHGDGTLHAPTTASQASVHPDDQAYMAGWPVKAAMLLTELLPTVGSGTNTQPLIFPDAGGAPLIGVASCCGPAYVFNAAGDSAYGKDPNGLDIALADTHFGPGSTAVDTPAIAGVGGLAVGSLDNGLHLSVVGPGTGLRRALSIAAIDEHSVGAEDQLAMWDARTGQYEPNAPIQINDLQFFTTPIVADIDGLGLASAIQSTAVGDTVAATLASTEFANIKRYHTGGWIVASAAVGAGPVRGDDGDSDNRLYMATVTREGYLRLYQTPMTAGSSAGCAALGQWPEKGHDARRSGNYSTDGERPYPLRNVAVARATSGALTLQFLATGDDRYCGRAASYQLRRESAAAPGSWKDATAVPISSVSGDAGSQLSAPLPSLPGGSRLLLRAYDDAGNGSAVAIASVPLGPTPLPATLAVTVPAPANLTRGSATPVFNTVHMTNLGGQAALVDSLTMQLSDPQAFAQIVVTAPDGKRVAIVNPAAQPVFNFTPAVRIPAQGAGDFSVEYRHAAAAVCARIQLLQQRACRRRIAATAGHAAGVRDPALGDAAPAAAPGAAGADGAGGTRRLQRRGQAQRHHVQYRSLHRRRQRHRRGARHRRRQQRRWWRGRGRRRRWWWRGRASGNGDADQRRRARRRQRCAGAYRAAGAAGQHRSVVNLYACPRDRRLLSSRR